MNNLLLNKNTFFVIRSLSEKGNVWSQENKGKGKDICDVEHC